MQSRLQTDSLTGLANREAFMLRLRQKIAQASASPHPARFAVLFIDLNRFKQINDRFGHDVGDQVLIEIAKRLRAMVRSRGSWSPVCRATSLWCCWTTWTTRTAWTACAMQLNSR